MTKRLCAVLLVLAWGTFTTAAKVPLIEFVQRPVVVSPVVSPNGRYLAVAKAGEDRKKAVIAVLDLDAPNVKPTIALAVEHAVVDWVRWANDDRLLMGLTNAQIIKDTGVLQFGFSRAASVDRRGGPFAVLFNNQRWLKYTQDLSEVVHPLPLEPNFVLMGASDEYGSNNLYRVNVADGRSEILHSGTRGTYHWLTDLQGNARVRWDANLTRGESDVLIRRGESDNWDVVATYDERELPDLNIVGFGDNPTTAIVASRHGGDRYGLYEYNIISRALGRQLFQHPSVDIGAPGGPIYDPHTTKLLGFSYAEDVWYRHYFDPELAGVQQKLETLFADAAVVRPTSWSIDRKRFVVVTEGPKDSGSYFLYDAVKGATTFIGKRFPKLPPSELGDMLAVKYSARDGTKIPGYLTMPPGKGEKNLPMIVMPHGGPELRDTMQFDSWVQMLANRGYAVFQPNFRGSGGYGKAVTEAGHRQWGRLMQHDISDGVKALIKEGTADPNRICIVGASYGGYAALAGGAFTPELYKCVVSVSGVSDIPQMLVDDKITHGADSYAYNYWKKWVGDPKIDLEQMKAVSPAYHAANFVAPVLLIHGKNDVNVRHNQSIRMDKALFKANKKSELVLLEFEGHAFAFPPSRLKMFTEIERFLQTHIGN
ncbi:MAG: prolyl oligopeptidase family serine peptidase [Alphaproteobacteria bacterium]|nr:prolyl oligopeptidase family serine peptidase [Alphaproteobacteria bacterium]